MSMVRLRRLDELLTSTNFPRQEFTTEKIQSDLSKSSLPPHLVTTTLPYVKYEQYLDWCQAPTSMSSGH